MKIIASQYCHFSLPERGKRGIFLFMEKNLADR
jgi:hypothetical protein